MSYTVKLPDGSTYEVTTLLGKGDSNAKLSKSDKADVGYMTVGLSLSPANESGYNVCTSASPGCIKACIFTSGHGQMDAVRKARIAKTIFFMENRNHFLGMLSKELNNANRTAKRKGLRLACRLNVFSDIQWEKIYPQLFTDFGDVQFYDYTKHYKRMLAHTIFLHGGSNYHLTFSRSETNDEQAKSIAEAGGNVTVVFADGLPETYYGRPVINGDETDLRFLDPYNVVVGLKAKGRGKKDTSGFIVRSVALPMV